MKVSKPRSGFTIVELLIVIVVIGILAAITLISYTGIQNRARVASLQSDLENASKTLENWKFNNAVSSGSESYPPDTTTGGVKAATGTVLDYNPNNTVSPASYCLGATTSNISYVIAPGLAGPQLGACVTNLIPNPSFELSNTSPTGWNLNSGSGTSSIGTTGGVSGSNFLRQSFTTPTTGANQGPYTNPAMAVTALQTYTAVASARFMPFSGGTQAFRVGIEWHGSATSTSYSASTTLTSSWTKLSVTANAPTGATSAVVVVYRISGSDWVAGDIVDFDTIMLIKGAQTTYGDGSSTGWSWIGTPNNSTSIGPSV